MAASCRGICTRYRVDMVANQPKYRRGLKRCSFCEIFLKTVQVRCPCCRLILRTRPRIGRKGGSGTGA